MDNDLNSIKQRIIEQRIKERWQKREDHQQTCLFNSHISDQQEDCLLQGS